jgi:2',3'-cyclic-nucleotide 2'-phosphodiesterase (5'-nucleotidase family)
MRILRVSLSGLCLLVASGTAQDTIRSFTIFHSNDLHAHLRPDSAGIGGLASLATELRRERAGCTTCLYLNAGDLVQGEPVSTIFHGIPVYQISNLLGIDAATLGNHEFDYGWRNILTFVKTARYPLITDNVVDATGHLLTGRGFVIKKLGGVRIAIIGVVMGDMVGSLVTAEQIGPWKVEPVVETLRRTVDRLQGKADLFVVVGHINSRDADQIMHRIPEISILVIGHEHTGYKEVRSFENRYAVEVKSYGAELGRLDFRFDTVKHEIVSVDWKRIPIDSQTIAAAPDVKKLVDRWEAKVSKIVDVPIGEARRRLAGADLRRLIEKAMAEESGADIAWINSGNVRGFLPMGPLLARHVWEVLPFDNYIMVGTFRGADLPARVHAEYPDLQPDRMYKVAVTDFSAANQESNGELGSSGLKFPVKGPPQRDAMIDWVRKRKVLE